MRVLVGVLAVMAGVAQAGAPEPIEYIPGLKKERFDNGETLLVKFQTAWSPTSARQEEILTEIMTEDPSYGQKLTFVTVDYDTYGKSRMAERLRVTRHGTLLIMRGGKVVERLEASIDKRELKAFLETVDSTLN
ncbi:thioredoxin family protein [Cognatishimia sp. MH4019]|uniref:thioredoxin family protein n=1 Tax=Cognatishimia sp. MH4019 TaxID=2854030 RepID=UPI001CD64223|nr:thioredoxin family protein [Cognatishimia sp. MH4019]